MKYDSEEQAATEWENLATSNPMLTPQKGGRRRREAQSFSIHANGVFISEKTRENL